MNSTNRLTNFDAANMKKSYETAQKQIEEIIERHKDFFVSCYEYDEIYVLGLSYNDTDRMYLREIAVHNDKAKWYFNWHSIEDRECIDHYALNLGVQNYKKINIEQW